MYAIKSAGMNQNVISRADQHKSDQS